MLYQLDSVKPVHIIIECNWPCVFFTDSRIYATVIVIQCVM